MKIVWFLLLSFNLFSSEIHGELLNFDEEVIGKCIASKFLIRGNKAKLGKLEFLGKKIRNTKFKYMIKNAIGGNLYTSKNRIGIVLNTDKALNLIQIKFSSEDLFLTCNF